VDPLRTEVKVRWGHGGGDLIIIRGRWLGDGMRRPRQRMHGGALITADRPGGTNLVRAVAAYARTSSSLG
jgi:hypothetical protein